jgi:predicted porin
MNKKLLTLAVGAALSAAPMIAAQAAVTVYGVAHLSIDSLSGYTTSTATGVSDALTTVGSNSSFIGFKADEDLGDGMKALFGGEFQVALDSATTGLANRNVFVGLGGGFGTVRVGNYDDVMKQVGRKVDLFFNEALGESRALTRASYTPAGAVNNNWDERLANSFNYATPSFSGLVGTINYGFANTTNDTTNPGQTTAYVLGLEYTQGPLYLGAAYKSIANSNPAGTPANGDDSTSAYRLSASFTLGDLKMVGLYQGVTNPGFTTNGSDPSTYGLGLAYTLGKAVIKGQYYSTDATNVAGTNGASMYALGLDYNLSKTTVVYLAYAQLTNDTAGTWNVIGAGHMNPQDATGLSAVTAGEDPHGYSLGMRMSF